MTTTLLIGGGLVEAVAGGPVSLSDLGSRTTRRLSRVEFIPAENRWEVTDAKTGERLFSHDDYDACIAWETSFFDRLLSEGINLAPPPENMHDELLPVSIEGLRALHPHIYPQPTDSHG